MIDIEDVIREVSKTTNIDKNIVAIVCKHPFLYTINIMKDKQSVDDILFNGLFKFKLKRRYKENKSKEYTSK